MNISVWGNMPVTKEQLAAEFAILSNKELLRRVDAGKLLPLEKEVALEELRSRGIDESSEGGKATDKTPAALPAGVELVTLLRLVNPVQANVLRAHLESEGLFVYLWGEHLGTAHLIFSTVTGGMRLQVRSDQLQRAQEVMAAFERGEYSLDSDFEP